MSVKDKILQNEEEGIRAFDEAISPLNLAKGPHDKLMSMFADAFCPSLENKSTINWADVAPIPDDQQLQYEQLPEPEDVHALFDKLVVIKLNGGLGTSMGCTVPKSIIVVKNGRSFFDIVVDQMKTLNAKHGVDMPLVLMNSFYTDDLMKPHIEKVEGLKILTFMQNKFPRIDSETLLPVPHSPEDPVEMWNPPGHGDVFHSLRDSGLLDQLIAEGKEYIFISNFDNLGASPNPRVFAEVVRRNSPWTSETVTKTPNDIKGGMPILYKGQVKQLETAQVPPDHMDDFCDMNFLNYFNCNNVYVNLHRLKQALDENKLILDVIKNKKVYNGRPVIQLEAACGSAIQSFPEARAIRVPRQRFIPVKTCNEFVVLRSDIYIMDGPFFVPNPERTLGIPKIVLGKCYTLVKDFEERFKYPLSLVNLKSLKVDGDVTFGENITLEGDVQFLAPEGEHWVIPSSKTYTNVTITSAADL